MNANYLHIYSWTGNDKSGDIEERFVAKIHRGKVSIDSRVYIRGRDFLARDGPLRSFVPNFIGVPTVVHFLLRLIFVWNSFFFFFFRLLLS